MKRLLLTILTLSLGANLLADNLSLKFKEHHKSAEKGVRYVHTIENNHPYTRSIVRVNGVEVPSQIDSLPGIGRQVAFLYDARRGTNRITITLSEEAPKGYEHRVWAQMYYKNRDKSLRKIDYVEEGADTMYNRLHHHGPAFENDEVTYRLYFDKKQTVDIYGKRSRGMELTETMWYPTDEQWAAGSGDDVLKVSGTMGVGTLKGWNSQKGQATHIDKFARRYARVISDGPVRTVVEMSVEGWEYCGRTIDLQSTYILWAEGRDCRVTHRLSGDWSGLQFATGVQKKFGERTPHITDSAVAVWGCDYPQPDTVKYNKETVGLVVWIPDSHLSPSPYTEDKNNYVALVEPDSSGTISYSFAFVWLREEWEEWSMERFFQWVDSYPVK